VRRNAASIRGFTIAPIQTAIEADERLVFFSPSDCQAIISVWLTAWMGSPDPRCPPSDVAFLQWLQDRLRAYDAHLYRPLIGPNDLSASPPSYVLRGYADSQALFDKNGLPIEAAGLALMTLLLAGAHLVAVFNAEHVPAGAKIGDRYDDFTQSGLDIRKDPANSHDLT
jgi:hypothetical protein